MPTSTFPLTGPIELVVRIGHGSVSVDTADGLTEAKVVVDPGKHAGELLAQTTIELTGRTLLVSAPRQGGLFDLPVFGRRAGRSLDVHIRVPTGTPVRISTFTAPITISGPVGGADLAWGAADVAVRDVDGDLRMRYGNGTAKAVRVTGSVQLRAGSGSAQFGEIGSGLSAGCGSGDLRARVVRGGVRSRSGSGTIELGEVHGDVDVVSGSGDVAIGLPAGVSAKLDVQTGSGRVDSELPIEDRPQPKAETIRLRARTGHGNVRLFRAA
ncbi:MAG TPA: DUF4097 family beta strand repeat-containing protein [Jatrophihabitans sp.]|jgi:hypothetical protein|nr:DUF4097 family beta strand repeat-containing protein [Jatrophihabitans sp.]